LKNLPARYLGSFYIEGPNYKGVGPHTFVANVPVTVLIAMDGRYPKTVPVGFEATGELVEFTHGRDDTVNFNVFKKDFAAGTISFEFTLCDITKKHGNMNGVFVMKTPLALSDVKILRHGHGRFHSHVRPVNQDSVKFSVNRGPYKLKNLPARYLGSFYIEGPNYKGVGPHTFVANVPVTVLIAMDGRYPKTIPVGFEATGELVEFTHGRGDTVNFNVFRKDFAAGTISFEFTLCDITKKHGNMNGVFVMEASSKDLAHDQEVEQQCPSGSGTVWLKCSMGKVQITHDSCS